MKLSDFMLSVEKKPKDVSSWREGCELSMEHWWKIKTVCIDGTRRQIVKLLHDDEHCCGNYCALCGFVADKSSTCYDCLGSIGESCCGNDGVWRKFMRYIDDLASEEENLNRKKLLGLCDDMIEVLRKFRRSLGGFGYSTK